MKGTFLGLSYKNTIGNDTLPRIWYNSTLQINITFLIHARKTFTFKKSYKNMDLREEK